MLRKITKKIKNSVFQYGNSNIAILNSKNVTVQNIQAMDQLQRHLQNGEIEKAVNLLRNMKDFMDSQHPAAPFWKYEIRVDEKGRDYVTHVPAYSGAEKEKPLTGSMRIVVPTHYKKNFKNMKELLDFSYGLQQEIVFELKSLKTWIGETLIEEIKANEKNNTKIKIIPQKFPPPSPMKLYLKDNSWSIDYLQIGVEKIVGSIITLNNYQQKNAPFAVQLILNIDSTTAKFNIKLTDDGMSSVKNILKFHSLIQISKKTKKPELALKLLEEDSDLISSFDWDFSENGNSKTEEFICFLNKIHFIEQEFNIEFKFQNMDYSNEELYFIDSIYNSLKDGYFKNKLHSYVFIMDDLFEIQKLFALHDEKSCLNVVHLKPKEYPRDFILLGIRFKIVTYEIRLENVKIENPEKIRMKSELLDDGESLKVKFLPYSSQSYISLTVIVEPV
ncbi:hypothetical protein MKZ20_21875 [Psychrobacillus sp. FSL K6-2684]|uniref:hypothetical protein n=1 Tax=unclassified Psychrobacillus TaxID=2636677 RepID=UPI0030FB43C6